MKNREREELNCNLENLKGFLSNKLISRLIIIRTLGLAVNLWNQLIVLFLKS